MEDVYWVQITRRWCDESPPRDEILTKWVNYKVWNGSHDWVRGEVLDGKSDWDKMERGASGCRPIARFHAGSDVCYRAPAHGIGQRTPRTAPARHLCRTLGPLGTHPHQAH